MYTYIYLYMYTCILACMNKKTYLYMVLYSNGYVHILTYTYVHTYIYNCVYVGEHIYLYAFFTCTFIHSYFPSRNHWMIKEHILRVTSHISNTVFCKAALLILEKERSHAEEFTITCSGREPGFSPVSWSVICWVVVLVFQYVKTFMFWACTVESSSKGDTQWIWFTYMSIWIVRFPNMYTITYSGRAL